MADRIPNPTAPTLAIGVDFTSAPTRRKPIVAALGRSEDRAVRLVELRAFADFAGFEQLLLHPGPWVGAFDLPFGLPRELVLHLGWPTEWEALVRHYASLERAHIRSVFADFCNARPAGAKFAHRACDAPAGSSPSMKWVNPPVAFMLHAGVPRLIDAGLSLPAHAHERGGGERVALEGYPGLLARELIGPRSYKSDTPAKQTREREAARRELVAALEQGRSRLALRLRLTAAQRATLIADAMADRLDAVLCLMQAAWAAAQPDHGLPQQIDPLEGWIVTAIAAQT